MDMRNGDTPCVQAPRRCAALNARGKPCGAWATPSGNYCIAHDAARRDEVAEIRRAGGEARGKPAPALACDLSSPTALRRALEITVDRLRDGREGPDVSRVVIAAVAAVRPVIELEHIAARLDALEAQAAERGLVEGDQHDD